MFYFVHPQIKFKKIKKSNIKEIFSKYFPNRKWVFTDMGRTAFSLLIENLHLQNSEILFPGYICDIFFPIFKKYNLKPVFLDINLPTFHIKKEEILKKLTPNTKSLLLCHTYGLKADVREIKKIVGENVFLIEDLAHGFFLKPESEFSFFSLYKQFPILRGGLLVYSKNWEISLPSTKFNFRDFISFLNSLPLFAFLFKKFSNQKIAEKLVRKEKSSQPASLNKFSLFLLEIFLKDFENSLPHRIQLAVYFQSFLKELGFEVQPHRENVFCYLTALVPKRLETKRDFIVKQLKKYNIFCTRIWHTPIILNKKVQKEYKINLKEFPNTIEAARRVINFPLQNYYSKKDIKKMINILYKILREL